MAILPHPKEVELIAIDKTMGLLNMPSKYLVVFHVHCIECGCCEDVVYEHVAQVPPTVVAPSPDEVEWARRALAMSACTCCASDPGDNMTDQHTHCSHHSGKFSQKYLSFRAVTKEGDKVWVHRTKVSRDPRADFEFEYTFDCGHKINTCMFKSTLELTKFHIRSAIENGCVSCLNMCNIYPELIELYEACTTEFEPYEKKILEKIIIKSFTETLKQVKDKQHDLWLKERDATRKT